MAYHLFIIILLTITFQFNNANSYLLTLNKDLQTHQYTNHLLIGTPQLPIKLVFHLSGDSISLNCPQESSSLNFIHKSSLLCLLSRKPSSDNQILLSHDTKCEMGQVNPLTNEAGFGEVVQDLVSVGKKFIFLCSSDDYLIKGLVFGAKGMLGFGFKSKIAFQNQVFDNFDISRKFVVCLSSNNGFIKVGSSNKITKSLSYTPLIKTVDGNGYFVNVNSVNVNGKKLGLGKPIGSVEISSIVGYTKMESSIYEVFKRGYLRAADSMNMTIVAPPMAPFEVCFISQEIVPEIELVLQSVFVKWKIEKKNLMVEVSHDVMCLGVLDGGVSMNGLMVLGGYQLEEHILEFNLGTSMMGFSGTLLNEGNSCSNVGGLVLSATKESL